MDEREFQRRTKQLALDVIALVEAPTPGRAVDVIGRQVLRSATSVGANYRASCRARSIQEIIAKLSIVEEESDETIYWLELLIDGGFAPGDRVRAIITEGREILAMTVASKKRLKSRINARSFAEGTSAGSGAEL